MIIFYSNTFQPKFKSEKFGPIEAVEYYSFMSQYVPVVKATLKGSRWVSLSHIFIQNIKCMECKIHCISLFPVNMHFHWLYCREACRAIERMEIINAKKTSDELRARLAMEPDSSGTPPSSRKTPPHTNTSPAGKLRTDVTAPLSSRTPPREGEGKVKDASNLAPPSPRTPPHKRRSVPHFWLTYHSIQSSTIYILYGLPSLCHCISFQEEKHAMNFKRHQWSNTTEPQNPSTWRRREGERC